MSVVVQSIHCHCYVFWSSIHLGSSTGSAAGAPVNYSRLGMMHCCLCASLGHFGERPIVDLAFDCSVGIAFGSGIVGSWVGPFRWGSFADCFGVAIVVEIGCLIVVVDFCWNFPANLVF